MTIKYCLILLTLISVVADTMLLPFYPQFFSETFNMHSTEHVGFYIAACCFTVMVSFPLWAKVASYIHELHLWIYTQLVAAGLGIACYLSTDLVQFWLLSQSMLVFKASYLLIYPFVMRLEEKNNQLGMVGLFAVLMHIGGIAGAIVGGTILQWYEPQNIYLVMVGSDLLQVVVCLVISKQLGVRFSQSAIHPTDSTSSPPTFNRLQQKQMLTFLGIVTALFYGSVFLIRPFFTYYWSEVTQINHHVVNGFAYAIPAVIALFCLWWATTHKNQPTDLKQDILFALILLIIGALLQSDHQVFWIIIGRIFFGWGLYQVTVKLELMLFQHSEPQYYAVDFSRLHIFQNIGIILSSLSVGTLVSQYSLSSPFFMAALGLAITLFVFFLLFKSPNKNPSTYSV